jgi:peptidoglycan/xylan/chitin deacetylase (PgdA/CDA1 family)
MMAPVMGPMLRGALSALDRLTPPRLSILIFHRVLPEPDPLFPHEMHARRFDLLMARVARAFNVLTIGEAHAKWSAGCLPPRALAITFDDGYADNAEIALPILQKHGLKATVFVATGYLDGGRMWNDTVIEAIRNCRHEALDLAALGLGRMPLRTVEERRAVIDATLPIIKYRSLDAREHLLTLFLQACGRPAISDTLMMRTHQVRELRAAGIEIGGHTVRHPILT